MSVFSLWSERQIDTKRNVTLQGIGRNRKKNIYWHFYIFATSVRHHITEKSMRLGNKVEISPQFLYVYNCSSFNYALLQLIFIIYFFGGHSLVHL